MYIYIYKYNFTFTIYATICICWAGWRQSGFVYAWFWHVQAATVTRFWHLLTSHAANYQLKREKKCAARNDFLPRQVATWITCNPWNGTNKCISLTTCARPLFLQTIPIGVSLTCSSILQVFSPCDQRFLVGASSQPKNSTQSTRHLKVVVENKKR